MAGKGNRMKSINKIQNIFVERYSFYNIKYLFSKARINSAVTKPKFLIEGSFILIIGCIAFFLKATYGLDPIPLLGGIAIGLQKLLPNVNGLFHIYSAMVTRYERSKNIENLDMCDQFSLYKMTIFINIAPWKNLKI